MTGEDPGMPDFHISTDNLTERSQVKEWQSNSVFVLATLLTSLLSIYTSGNNCTGDHIFHDNG